MPDETTETEFEVQGEEGKFYIARDGERVSVQEWTERSTADYALEHGHWTTQA